MFRLEAMLSLLVLALLGTPTFSAETYYGRESGTHFCTSIPEGKILTGIRVYFKGRAIAGIQMRFGDDWGQIYGYETKNTQEALLNKDESITIIFGRFNLYFNQLGFSTNMPREILFGTRRTIQEFFEAADKPDYVLRGLCGFYGFGGIRAFRPRWGTVNGTCSN
ncbi:prostatic spermine-binding protein-like [Meriones unguiculatus]|uniref:prostatic spermine-binding protein-like n=1 Tax=Meriones unguiculatus TaxID=10047 RepID=UPI00293F4D58|nr:prostatic spermine-binding protein-like [Meriones unguiculatus]